MSNNTPKTVSLWRRYHVTGRRLRLLRKTLFDFHINNQQLIKIVEVRNNPKLLHTLSDIDERSENRLEYIGWIKIRYRRLLWPLIAYYIVPSIFDRRPKQHQISPPIACYLLELLLTKADRQVIPGDMQEEFAAKLVKYGPKGAHLWFWAETARVLAGRNPLCRWILIVGLVRVAKWIMRILGG